MKRAVCIFAHPDDEAFGPGGTIALLSQTHEVTLICVTNGDAGLNSTRSQKELSKIRRAELRRSAAILGVKDVIFLGYKDGTLSNALYHEIAEKLIEKLQFLQPDTLLTYEPRGVSGHIDHIAVSMITSFIFPKIPSAQTLLYYCISEENRTLHGDYFIYFPQGYRKDEIDRVVDVSSVWEKKVAGMKEHKSQKHDADSILERYKKLPKEEYFLVKEK